MKFTTIKICFICLGLVGVGTLQAQSARGELRKGNKAYSSGAFDMADSNYAHSLQRDSLYAKGWYNKGNAEIRNQEYEKAMKSLERASRLIEDEKLKSDVYHNIGNVLLEQKEYEKSAEMYKKALILDPSDEETRYNLAYAMKHLQGGEGDSGKDKEEGSEGGDENQENQEGQGDENGEKEDDGKEKKEGKEENESQELGDETGKGQSRGLSKEEAEQLLESLEREERELQRTLMKKSEKGNTDKKKKDW